MNDTVLIINQNTSIDKHMLHPIGIDIVSKVDQLCSKRYYHAIFSADAYLNPNIDEIISIFKQNSNDGKGMKCTYLGNMDKILNPKLRKPKEKSFVEQADEELKDIIKNKFIDKVIQLNNMETKKEETIQQEQQCEHKPQTEYGKSIDKIIEDVKQHGITNTIKSLSLEQKINIREKAMALAIQSGAISKIHLEMKAEEIYQWLIKNL